MLFNFKIGHSLLDIRYSRGFCLLTPEFLFFNLFSKNLNFVINILTHAKDSHVE